MQRSSQLPWLLLLVRELLLVLPHLQQQPSRGGSTCKRYICCVSAIQPLAAAINCCNCEREVNHTSVGGHVLPLGGCKSSAAPAFWRRGVLASQKAIDQYGKLL
jgi:hypothetical protein